MTGCCVIEREMHPSFSWEMVILSLEIHEGEVMENMHINRSLSVFINNILCVGK